jgi:hypothetical protein
MELLFTMAHWHGLAKLRMHNDCTLAVLDTLTVSLGKRLRNFTLQTCPAFQTKELRREVDARVRREARKSASKAGGGIPSHINISAEQPTVRQQLSVNTQDVDMPGSSNLVHPSSDLVPDPTAAHQRSVCEAGHAPVNTHPRVAGRRRKTFNLSTYALHSLGDYANTIRQFGTTDSFSTEAVSYLFK